MLGSCRKQKESRPLTETSEQQAAALLSALSTLEPGSLYYDKYVVEQGQRRGANSIIAFAHTKAEPHQQARLPVLGFSSTKMPRLNSKQGTLVFATMPGLHGVAI